MDQSQQAAENATNNSPVSTPNGYRTYSSIDPEPGLAMLPRVIFLPDWVTGEDSQRPL